MIEVLRPGDRLILVFPRSVTSMLADQIKEKIKTLAPELLAPIVLGGCSVIVSRGFDVSIDNESPGQPVINARIPIDPALLAGGKEPDSDLLDEITKLFRYSLEEHLRAWPA